MSSWHIASAASPSQSVSAPFLGRNLPQDRGAAEPRNAQQHSYAGIGIFPMVSVSMVGNLFPRRRARRNWERNAFAFRRNATRPRDGIGSDSAPPGRRRTTDDAVT